ncbi:MAG: N-6 DNA methylase [Chloroflexi bacterium]|nr:N-6 DNA methylase [Chloroflexota bacterium]
MSEELLQTVQHQLDRYSYHRLGATTLALLQRAEVIRGPVPRAIRNRKPDGLITLGNEIKAYIEYKPPSELQSAKQIQEVIGHTVIPARELCNLAIVTDGNRTYWVNPHTSNEVRSDRMLPVLNAQAIVAGTISREDIQLLEEIIDQADYSLSRESDALTSPELLDPSQLARSIWQKIWINTGKEPEKCLYNVVELFVFKFLSDLGILVGHNSFSHVYELSVSHDYSEALRSYAAISRRAIKVLFPEGSDGTTIINGTIFVNEKGEPNLAQSRLFSEVLVDLHKFEKENGSLRYIRREFKTRLYESFLREGAGLRHLGQFFTPRNVVRAMVQISEAHALPPGASLCDPFCGVGGFLLEAIIESPRLMENFRPRDGVIEPKVTIVGYDKGSDEKEDERTVVLAKANAIIYFSDFLARYHTTSVILEFTNKVVNRVFQLLRTNLGTFAVDDENKHDLILTNPPYVTSGSRSLKLAIKDAGISNRYVASGRGTEALAIQWIIRSLKHGGSAFVIVPDGLLNQQGILDHIKQNCIVNAVVSLPVRTFYSTPKKTYILGLRRKDAHEDIQRTPIFTYLVSEIGETRDARRWDLPQNDLVEMASLFNQFKGAPAAFSVEKPRCKIVEFQDFEDWQHWMVERYWTLEELTDLGVAEESNDISLEELNSLLPIVGESEISSLDFSDVSFVNVALGDEELFSLRIGKRVLKKECIDSGIPCISSNVREVFGYIAQPDLLDDFDQESLTWGVDGIFEWYLIPRGYPFHPTDHCGVLRILNKNIDPEYLFRTLHADRTRHGFDRTFRANLKNVANVFVSIPVDGEGKFDLATQRVIAKKYREIEEKQSRIRDLLDRVSGSQVDLTL